ncbi:S8 family serine peptidase [candidate division KSB1 bacterium]|nr:S8 family serine peptidase [candidate division KSB1 bacterium]
MRKFVFVLLFISQVFGADFSKLDPQLGLLMKYPLREKYLIPDKQLYKKAGETEIDVIVTFNGDIQKLRARGFRVYCTIGDIAVLSVPVKRLGLLSELPNVNFIEAAKTSVPQLNFSVPLTGANKVREQLGYKGAGVIIGVIDTGIDWKHRDFIDAKGFTRIKFLLDLSKLGPYMGGILYTEDDINSSLSGQSIVTQYDYSGHGTHVAGIAAGDDSDGPGYGEYAGMAPEADLIIVKATTNLGSSEFLNTKIITAMAFIDSVAATLGKPYVINLSLGGYGGAHDGTSPVERVIDELTGPDVPGKAVVTAAGNDGEANYHAQALSGDRQVKFQIHPYLAGYSGEDALVVFDIWYGGQSNIDATIISPSGQRYGPVVLGQMYHENSSDGTIFVWNGCYLDSAENLVTGQNIYNGDYELYIELRNENTLLPPRVGEWTIKFTGTADTIDVYLASTTLPVTFTQGMVDYGKITIPATARNCIAVGSYISKLEWIDLLGNPLTMNIDGTLKIGDISTFSSPGPTRDGRIKPELTAPGQMIASSYSEKSGPFVRESIFYSPFSGYRNGLIREGGRQGLSQGTSMAAPHVAGAIVLLLQKFPQATATELRQLLVTSATADQFVGSIPNFHWGWGKLNVLSAIQMAPGEDPPGKFKLLNIYPNPFGQRSAIEFELPLLKHAEKTKIFVYNILGQRVRTLMEKNIPAGEYKIYWDGCDDLGNVLASGIYIIRFESGEIKQTQKVTFWPPSR